ncbi:MAG: Mini-ribonuclease 3 [Firmicutes bacterium]|nr:Mini-ribonuclease 3 [Bacillota bacterium]
MDYRQLSPDTWAYLGDAVFELLVRRYFVDKYGTKARDLHKRTTAVVNAEAQAQMLKRLEPYLSETESEVVRRGRNSAKRPGPKGVSVQEYRFSTGLEALFGYLYLQGDQERLEELFRNGFGEEN